MATAVLDAAPRPSLRGILPAPQRLALPALPPAASSTAAAPTQPTAEGRPVKRLSQSEMEERRRLELCFNCNEKFVRGHNHVCQRIFFLDLADDDDDAAETGADAP